LCKKGDEITRFDGTIFTKGPNLWTILAGKYLIELATLTAAPSAASAKANEAAAPPIAATGRGTERSGGGGG